MWFNLTNKSTPHDINYQPPTVVSADVEKDQYGSPKVQSDL